jgi:hypothetical protein
MSPEDIKKLLGGYATGTLTAEEQQALFAAALEDQELFDALAHEQSLRDLLRDPAARAELLGALATPAARVGGFWQWLRRPMVAGLATAGVAGIVTVVAVWQGTRVTGVKPAAPVIVAELKRQEPVRDLAAAQPAPLASHTEVGTRPKVADAPSAVTANQKAAPPMAQTMAPPPVSQPEAGARTAVAGANSAVMADKKAAPPVAQPMAPPPASEATQASKARKDEAAATALAAAPPPPPATPAAPAAPPLMPRKAKTESTALGQSVGAIFGALQENVPLDARALFYLNPVAPGANAFVQSGSGGGAPLPAREAAPQTTAAPRKAQAVSGLVAHTTATAPRLGVRISILRGTGEVDLTTVLDAGETVRLKVIPNADGFLYVAEGTRLVASGAAQRLKPFETPELPFEGSGQKQWYVVLSRSPQTAIPNSPGNLARGNLVETSADPDHATYFVSGPGAAGAQQVVVPVTLTYR